MGLVMITRSKCTCWPHFPAGDLGNKQELLPDWLRMCVRWFCLLTTYYVLGAELSTLHEIVHLIPQLYHEVRALIIPGLLYRNSGPEIRSDEIGRASCRERV